jgi:hypothetical protein
MAAAFHWHVLDRGIKHFYMTPGRPSLNGRMKHDTGPTRRSSISCLTIPVIKIRISGATPYESFKRKISTQSSVK